MKLSRFAVAGLGLALLAGSAATQPKGAPDVDPEAIQAVQRMRAYLGTLTAFEVKADSTIEVVLEDGQKVQLEGVTTYKVRRPNGFVIEAAINNKVRQFFYDGRQFTIFAPKYGYYAQVPAPQTIAKTLDEAYDRYGISLPLEDLFHWSEPGEKLVPVTSAIVLGDAVVGGVDTDQYLFRQDDRDWQIWIQKGDQPIPRKLVIVDRTDDARPAYTARLTWNVRPNLTAGAFTFRPSGDAKAIRLSDASR